MHIKRTTGTGEIDARQTTRLRSHAGAWERENIMARFARENGIKLKPKFSRREKVPSGFLNTVFNDLDAYANQSGSSVAHWQSQRFPWLKKLRREYCHFSAHYGKVLRVVAPNKPNIDNGKRIRATHYG